MLKNTIVLCFIILTGCDNVNRSLNQEINSKFDSTLSMKSKENAEDENISPSNTNQINKETSEIKKYEIKTNTSKWNREYIKTVFSDEKIYSNDKVTVTIEENNFSYFINGELNERHTLIRDMKYFYPHFFFKDYPCDMVQYLSSKELLIIRDCYEGKHEYFIKN